MKARTRIFSLLGLVLILIAVLLPASMALAQSNESGPSRTSIALASGVLLVCAVIGLVIYVYSSLALQTIANKTNTPNAWFAWIPIILNAILALNIAKKPIWWIILLFVPIVNIVIGIIVCMEIAKARGKPSWWGILLIIPLVNLIAIGYLAWSK